MAGGFCKSDSVEETMSNKTDEAGRLIHMFAIAHGGIAFSLANTAIGDTVLLAGLTFYMIHKLGKIYGVEDIEAKPIIGQTLTHYAGPYLAGKLLFWLPGIGNWANAATTVLLTETMGWTCVSIFSAGKKPEELSHDDWESILNSARAKAEEHQEENKILLRKMTAEDKKKLKIINKKLKDDAISEEEKEILLESLEKVYEDIKSR